MGDTLHTWLDGTHVGVFHRTESGRITFRYDSPDGAPVSLSLPRTDGIRASAPEAFLENLLPEDGAARARMALRLHVDSTDPFALLREADTVGGLTFTAEAEPRGRTVVASPVDDEEIARQVGYAARNGHHWFARDPDDEFSERPLPRCRFSIAGGQPKITLARRAGVWLWPNIAIPSTHILKAEVRGCAGSDRVEDATMTLGGLCGLPVAEHGVWEAEGAHAFIVRRFDRIIRDGTVHRLHCEDLAQAMGLRPDMKYAITAADCVRFLRRHDPTDGMAYEWIRRLAFNVSSADCDSHGRNYSIIPGADGFRFAPMYDMAATRTWPHLDQEMAMPVNGVQYAELLTPHDWEAFAVSVGLDGERVVHTARTMAYHVLERREEATKGVPGAVRDAMLNAIGRANEAICPLDGLIPAGGEPKGGYATGGLVWVGPHTRSGHAVSGYWRSR